MRVGRRYQLRQFQLRESRVQAAQAVVPVYGHLVAERQVVEVVPLLSQQKTDTPGRVRWVAVVNDDVYVLLVCRRGETHLDVIIQGLLKSRHFRRLTKDT